MSPSRFALISRLVLLSLLATAVPGCGLFRGGSATRQRLDPPREVPHHPTNVKPRTMQVEVTTDASGAVADVNFTRSSGSGAVDNYVAENIRHTWPANPSNRSLVEITYSAEKGFSEPRLISSIRAP